MRIILNFILALAPVTALAAPVVEQPAVKGLPTSFAIIADEATYRATKPSMLRYRDAVEGDGLSTYIIHDDWKSPDAVRQAIGDLRRLAPNLEGIVLVGDVPVAMVRNGQHMTTAFKMDEERYPWEDSSVPSDRFYDCPDLEFRFVRQDTSMTHLYYYELLEDSPQRLSPAFYSARIRYPQLRGGDKHEAIARFLDKAARAKKEMAGDQLDCVVSFNGHGYNSDCLMMWMDEEKAYRENFPLAFNSGTSFKHLNFRMVHPTKNFLFEELLRPEVDLFMFHEHGAPTTQYINGEEPSSSDALRYRHLKSYIYQRVKRAVSRGAALDEVKGDYKKKYALTEAFFGDYDNPRWWSDDSIATAAINIEADEFHKRTTQPRIAMFDACYNGSFHEDDYIAGEYLFNDGNTLAAQGNTRNVLQDRWTIEMIGLLSHGLRVGHYNRMVATLEGHLMGDPTVHFAPVVPNSVAADVTLRRGDSAYWQSLLNSPYADLRSLALRMMVDADSARTLSPMLLDVYRTSPFNTVRMEAVKLLSRYRNGDFTEAVRLGLNDPYELVARLCADYAGAIGDPSLLPAMMDAYLDGSERNRVSYKVGNALSLFPAEAVNAAIDGFYATANRMNSDQEKQEVVQGLARNLERGRQNADEVADKSLKDSQRIQAIRTVRNYPYHPNLAAYLNVIADGGNSVPVRVNMTEALGWFNNSVRRPEIITFCQEMISRPDTPAPLRAELTQTLRRLTD